MIGSPPRGLVWSRSRPRVPHWQCLRGLTAPWVCDRACKVADESTGVREKVGGSNSGPHNTTSPHRRRPMCHAVPARGTSEVALGLSVCLNEISSASPEKCSDKAHGWGPGHLSPSASVLKRIWWGHVSGLSTWRRVRTKKSSLGTMTWVRSLTFLNWLRLISVNVHGAVDWAGFWMAPSWCAPPKQPPKICLHSSCLNGTVVPWPRLWRD